jgi:transcriptional repressor NrdR
MSSPHVAYTFPLVFLPGQCQYIDMVCIYCGSPTKVTNSRPQKRLLQVWRRRACTQCGALFTTNEIVDLTTSLSVRLSGGRPRPFSRDKLFVSILRSVGHRDEPLDDANGLTATIISKIIQSTTEAFVEPSQIIAIALDTLQRFDAAAAIQYKAYHRDK